MLQPDINEAKKFIGALYGDVGARLTFQFYKEDGSGALTAEFGTLDEKWDRLVNLNQNKYAICIMINQGDFKVRAPRTNPPDADGNEDAGTDGRKTENVIALTALFTDRDSDNPQSDTSPLHPSIVVKTAHGEHRYWLLKPGEDLKQFTPAQTQLIKYFNTDKKPKDLPRVLRLPGFFNQKPDLTAPVMIKIQEINDRHFTISEVLAAYPIPIEVEAPSAEIRNEVPTVEAFALAQSYVENYTPSEDGHTHEAGLAASAYFCVTLGLNAKEAYGYFKRWDAKNRVSKQLSEGQIHALLRSTVAKRKEGILKAKKAAKDAKKHKCITEPTKHIAFHIGSGTYFLFDGKSWEPDNVGQKQAIKYAITKSRDKDELICIECDHPYAIKNFKTTDFAPYKPIEFRDANNNLILNTWVEPTIKYAEGRFPSITKIIQRMVNYDESSERYWNHWLAFKVQHPEMMNGHAIVFVGAHGTGKSSLMSAIFDILGRDNCYKVEQTSLTKPYNSHFATKCFINANEIEAPKRSPDALASKLKGYIADATVEVEAKGSSRYSIPNHASWVFTTNYEDALFLEKGDRRFTIFNDGIVGKDVPEEHSNFIKTLWEVGNVKTPAFKAEVAAYAWYLQHLEVDLGLISSPLKTQAKVEMTEAHLPMTIEFMNDLEFRGLKALAIDIPEFLTLTLVEKGGYVVGNVLYKCFQKWCKDNKSPQVFIPSSKALYRALATKYTKTKKEVGIVFQDIPLNSKLQGVA
jgi:Family of unknown function (DUF5906)